jgi:hypothetical protein
MVEHDNNCSMVEHDYNCSMVELSVLL